MMIELKPYVSQDTIRVLYQTARDQSGEIKGFSEQIHKLVAEAFNAGVAAGRAGIQW